MAFFSSFQITASALTAHRLWLDTIVDNIANANTTRTPAGGTYNRKDVVFEEILEAKTGFKGGGVRVSQIVEDTKTPYRYVFNPNHPDADPNTGLVKYPNVNINDEIVNLLAAQRAYEANVTVFNTAKAMYAKALELSR
ncbi:flagellar basal body rod protein FlgC [Carboxydothermus ferrireducens]|uniref:Flagellar basal-body rod protein FlgC n=1 Tax=Carboxydothermus ferrireducens DSM 11255 TaxID=1119529 RepID=A0ABX2R6W3_9THEO|nr:flagellar basal body rod protein FlgC [Carboxydothermus ferrireducens]NYE56894.1 flagellar basal-body rod protein FlgC [Carboxydothermus ferrireducens DSM 11255]